MENRGGRDWVGSEIVLARFEHWSAGCRHGQAQGDYSSSSSSSLVCSTRGLSVGTINTRCLSGITYIIVARFLIFVALFVGFGFGLVGFALLHVQSLPPLSENLADLACITKPMIS